MQCLKCGKETEGNQVFCQDCLNTMEDYPVKSTTPVHLPQAPVVPITPKKVSRRKWSLSPEDQISHLKATVRRLAITVAVLSILIVIGAGVLGKTLYTLHVLRLTGKNYEVETTPPTTSSVLVPSDTRVP